MFQSNLGWCAHTVQEAIHSPISHLDMVWLFPFLSSVVSCVSSVPRQTVSLCLQKSSLKCGTCVLPYPSNPAETNIDPAHHRIYICPRITSCLLDWLGYLPVFQQITVSRQKRLIGQAWAMCPLWGPYRNMSGMGWFIKAGVGNEGVWPSGR